MEVLALRRALSDVHGVLCLNVLFVAGSCVGKQGDRNKENHELLEA